MAKSANVRTCLSHCANAKSKWIHRVGALQALIPFASDAASCLGCRVSTPLTEIADEVTVTFCDEGEKGKLHSFSLLFRREVLLTARMQWPLGKEGARVAVREWLEQGGAPGYI